MFYFVSSASIASFIGPPPFLVLATNSSGVVFIQRGSICTHRGCARASLAKLVLLHFTPSPAPRHPPLVPRTRSCRASHAGKALTNIKFVVLGPEVTEPMCGGAQPNIPLGK
uniref:Uncharacterized protein n=1 Tax=Pyxicephalus adspersus TaxID=30357 RepID=A0AAV2ZXF2_PYXAD|nr:TPA: hypothetical protein GDO54_004015 [Pyxicephalus adspersus]